MIKKISLSFLFLVAIMLTSVSVSAEELKNILNANIANKKEYIPAVTNSVYVNPVSVVSNNTKNNIDLKPLNKPVTPPPMVVVPTSSAELAKAPITAVPTSVIATPSLDGNVASEKHSVKDASKDLKSDQYDQEARLKKAEFVNKISSLDYHTQNPPQKLYNRSPTIYNKHLPPVYFKSYYLSLAFKAAERNDNNGLNAVLAQFNFLNGQNKDGDTILMSAIQHNSLNVARLLLAKGAYIDAVNHRKRTALHYAATLGELDLIKLLLSMGADYTLVDDREMTAMDYAHANHQPEAAEMIGQYIEQNKFNARN